MPPAPQLPPFTAITSAPLPSSFMSSSGMLLSWNRPPPPKPSAPSVAVLWKVHQLCFSLPHLPRPPVSREQVSMSVSGFIVSQLRPGGDQLACATLTPLMLSHSAITCLSDTTCLSAFPQPRHCPGPLGRRERLTESLLIQQGHNFPVNSPRRVSIFSSARPASITTQLSFSAQSSHRS